MNPVSSPPRQQILNQQNGLSIELPQLPQPNNQHTKKPSITLHPLQSISTHESISKQQQENNQQHILKNNNQQTNQIQTQTQPQTQIQTQIHANQHVSKSTKQVDFPVYSSVLDIRMPISERNSSLTRVRLARNLSHPSEYDPRRKVDSSHPFQKLHHQSTDLSQSVHSIRKQALDRHKKSARQARPYQKHPLDLILCCHDNSPADPSPSVAIPLTQSTNHDERELLNSHNHNTSELNPTTRPTKRRIYLPLQTIVSGGLLLAIPSLFIYSTASSLINHQKIIGTVILSIFSYVWLISLASMIKTVTSDPGILPRGLDPNPEMEWKPQETDEEQPILSTPPQSANPTASHQPEEKKSALEVGEWELFPRWIKVETFHTQRNLLDSDKLDHSIGSTPGQHAGWVQSKWCTVCELYRPPRSSHCRVCDCCIDGIDHHCSYLNNCIGSRNYRPFFVFLLTSSLDLVIMIACSIWKLFFLKFSSSSNNNGSSQSTSIPDSLKSNPIDLAVISSSILIFIPIFALASYHIFLTCNGLTTIEYIKARTTKKVIKENSKLVDQFYNNGQAGEAEERRKIGFGSRLLSKLICSNSNSNNGNSKSIGNSSLRISNTQSMGQDQQQHQQRSNNFVIGRLCRPDTDAFIDWNSLI